MSVIDTATDRVVSSIDVGANPHGLAISGDGSRVLVSGWGSNRALVIDTVTDRVIGEVPVAQPHNGTLSRDGRTGWVASQQQGATALVRLDLTTGRTVPWDDNVPFFLGDFVWNGRDGKEEPILLAHPEIFRHASAFRDSEHWRKWARLSARRA